MKVFILADGSSAHTKRWVISLLEQNIDIYLFSLNGISRELKEYPSNKLNLFDASNSTIASSAIGKLGYLGAVPRLKKELRNYSPDLVHAHYISSYGLLSYLSGYRPYVLSVWGSDIMQFPTKSFFHKFIIELILKQATKVFATSKLMLHLLQHKFNIRNSLQIPFGVDTKKFIPEKKNEDFSSLTFAIVKSLTDTYGIDIAINSFIKLANRYPSKSLKLEIYGDGPLRKQYEALAGSLFNSQIFFHGKIDHSVVPEKLNCADVFLNVSKTESFGVSVLEASSCGLPVIVSNRGGLPETVIDEKTGIILKKLDIEHCRAAMEKYLLDRRLVEMHGTAGRDFVEEYYSQHMSVKKQIDNYQEIIEESKN